VAAMRSRCRGRHGRQASSARPAGVLRRETGPRPAQGWVQPPLQNDLRPAGRSAPERATTGRPWPRVMLCVTQQTHARPTRRVLLPKDGPTREPYIVRSVVHAVDVLGAFRSSGETLRLRDVVERTRFGRAMCFRLLHTLHQCGLLEKVDESRYRLISEIRRHKRYRIGYGAQGQDSSFPREVHAGLQRAAEREDVELIVVNNRDRK